MENTLPIDEVRRRLYFKVENYEGYKITQNRKSVIGVGESALFLVELPPKAFPKGNITAYVMTVTVMEEKDFEFYKDEAPIVLLITKQDYEFIVNTLMVKKKDKIMVKGNNYKNKLGHTIHGKKWFKIRSKEDKQKEMDEQGISLED